MTSRARLINSVMAQRSLWCALARRNAGGFTLIELMIVVTIVAIAMTLAVPAYQEHIRKAKRTVGRGELLTVLARQEQFFVNNKQYSTLLTNLGYSASPYAISSNGSKVAVDDSNRSYLITLTNASPTGYTLNAVPQLAQATDRRCGTLTITSTGIRSQSGMASASECW
ncbi:MAG: type IV pilin protein [Halieaceae bacterium]|jgi:type IV pilus assembly protein PilE|nr:type IV pilin protein [Halieaceae bacterium]